MFKEKERGAIVQELLLIVATVIVIGIFTSIGSSIMAQTMSTTSTSLTDVNAIDTNYYDSLIAANRNAAGLVEDTTSYSTILIIAVIGGLALAAIMAYMWVFGGGSGGSRAMTSAY